jgi:ADP-ribose pyrophosphatase
MAADRDGRSPHDGSVEMLSRETGYRGFFSLERLTLRHSLFGGGMSPPITRELIEKGDVAAVLLYDPELDRVVLIEQFRIGAVRDPDGPWMLEVVAGLIEQGESPEDVARREAMEEAGCAVLDLVPIATFYASPSKTTERSFLYCGRVDAARAGGVHGLAHEGEDIRVVPLDAGEALQLLQSGRVNSAWPMIALQWLALNRERIRSRWLERSG